MLFARGCGIVVICIELRYSCIKRPGRPILLPVAPGSGRTSPQKGQNKTMDKNKLRSLLYLGATLLAVLNVFVNSPNLNPLYLEGALFWCVLLTVYAGIYVLTHFGDIVPVVYPNGMTRYTLEFTGGSPKKLLLAVAAPWALVLAVLAFSSPLLDSAAYRDQLGEPEVRAFSSDLQVMDQSQLPIVDRDLAKNLADKKLGERPSLGSQAYVGEPTIQQVDGRLVWVAPLHHSGLFKWFTNRSGTPGYIVVSATNVNDVEYVDAYPIKYQPDSYLLDDLERHLRLNGALFDGIVDESFELDDSGQPYWIVTSYRNTRGFALPEARGVYAVNASTGETTYYSIDEVPDWIDRVQPEDFVLNQINNQGEYVHGIFNFSDKDKFRTSEGEAIIYNNGSCYLFTGLTSIGQDESAIGFIMVDMVTKQPILYQMNGATEESAQLSAQGKVQYQGYKASFPIILNVDGMPTYFMPMKDSAGLIKQYAFVSVTNYSSVGVGETIAEALEDYADVLAQSGDSTVEIGPGETATARGTVLRIASHSEGAGTVYSLILSGYEDRIFTAEVAVSPELPITREGDLVRLDYREDGGFVNAVTAFDNEGFTQGSLPAAPPEEAAPGQENASPEESPAQTAE